MEDLISVVVPVYNVEEYLDRCVKSIVNQTYQNLEIILVDDGSTDNSGKMCDEWAQKDERIEVIHKVNGGLSDARNAGIEIAKGDYIGFVDSDDFIRNDMYEILLKNLKYKNADVSVASFLIFSDESCVEKIEKVETNLEYYENVEVFKKLFSNELGDVVVAWNKLYSRKIFKTGLRFPKGRIHEDDFFIHKMLDEVTSIVYTNETVYFYYQRNGSISHVFSLKRLDELDGMYDRMCFFQQERFKNTDYPLLATLAYQDKLIRFYCYLKYYNEKHCYDENIQDVRRKFTVNYKKIIQSSANQKKKIKYIFFKNFPNIFYFLNRKRFIYKSWKNY